MSLKDKWKKPKSDNGISNVILTKDTNDVDKSKEKCAYCEKDFIDLSRHKCKKDPNYVKPVKPIVQQVDTQELVSAILKSLEPKFDLIKHERDKSVIDILSDVESLKLSIDMLTENKDVSNMGDNFSEAQLSFQAVYNSIKNLRNSAKMRERLKLLLEYFKI